MIGAALGWLAGCLLTHALPGLPSAIWIVPGVLICVAVLRTRAAPCVIGAVAACAWTAHVAHERLADRLDQSASGRDFELRGWIDDFPRRGVGQVSFSLRVVSHSAAAALPQRVSLVWYRPAIELEPGAALALTARLRRPRGLANPGGSDAEQWALIEGVGATGYVRSGQRTELPMQIDRWWLSIRARLAERLQRPSTSPEANALIVALALGETQSFTDELWTRLARTGTTHLVAISGQHIALVAGLLFVVLRRLCLHGPAQVARRDLGIAGVLAWLGAAAYAALAGFTLPTQRALLMLAVGIAVLGMRRRARLLDALAVALVFVLIWDPFGTLRAALWLSFGAVAMIGMAASVRASRESPHGVLAGIRQFLEIQWAVTIGLTPVVAIFFAQLGIVAPLVNILAVPVFSLALVPAVLAAALLAALGAQWLLGWWLPWVGGLADLVWVALEHAAALDWAAFALAPPQLWATVLAALGAAVLLPGVPPLRGRLAAAALLVAVLEGYRDRPAPGELRTTVLDVGHGLAVLVRTARHALLYDAGPRYPSGFDAGRQTVLPALTALGVRRLDRVVLSHADADHAGGAPAVAARFPAADWLVGPDVLHPGGQRCAAGQRWSWDGVEFSMLHPLPGSPARGNSNSCVLRIEAAGHSLVLTGDIEADAESALVASDTLHGTSVVVVPHHGSATSSTPEFVGRLRPYIAIASAAYRNRWNFPRPEVRARWEQAGARLWVTGDVGAIEVLFAPGQPLRVSAERMRRRRYWSADRDTVSGASDWSAL